MWISIDIDNTVNNFIDFFIENLKGIIPSFKLSDFTDYDIAKVTNIDRSILSTLFFENNRFSEQLCPLPDCQHAINYLHYSGHNIQFVTSRSYKLINATISFMSKYFSFLNIDDSLILTQKKENVWADVVIDDYLPNLCNCNPNCKFILKDQPWNKDTVRKDFIRFSNWKNIPGIIENIEHGVML